MVKKWFLLMIKGFFIGIAKMIPGASGSVLAISFGIYEKGVQSIRYFYRNIKKNTLFLFPIGFGILIAISMLSQVIHHLLQDFYLPTMLLFLGIMSGSVPKLYRKMNVKSVTFKNIIFFSLILLLVIFSLYFLKGKLGEMEHIFLMYFWIGIVETITMIVPGVSGTAVLMLLDGYYPYLELLSTLLSPSSFVENIQYFLPFLLGFLVGTLLGIAVISHMFNRHKENINVAIFLFMIGSIAVLFVQTLTGSYALLDVVIALILLLIGYKVGQRL